MRVRVAFAGLLLLAVLPLPAHATIYSGTLTITGARTSYAMLKVTRQTSYDLRSVEIQDAGGRWGGFAIGNAVPWLHLVDDLAGPPSIAGFPTTLKPGRWYKVYLFTDGQPVTVKVPWTGPDRTITTDSPFDASVRVERTAGGFGLTPIETAVPLDGGARSRSFFVLRYQATVGPDLQMYLCTTSVATRCAEGRGLALYAGSHSFNTFGLGTGAEGRTIGRYARGEVRGGSMGGVLTILALRWNP